jgi:hypothetical protein
MIYRTSYPGAQAEKPKLPSWERRHPAGRLLEITIYEQNMRYRPFFGFFDESRRDGGVPGHFFGEASMHRDGESQCLQHFF